MVKKELGKEVKTINFDVDVLRALEKKARDDGSKVSSLVNFICKRIVFSDEDYYREKAKFHYLKFQEYDFMKDRVKCVKTADVNSR